MPYVRRNAAGQITSLEASNVEGADFVDADDARLQAFISGQAKPEDLQQLLRNSDQEFVRVSEDLIHLLVEKQVILFTDLPTAVQNKLLAREQYRNLLSGALPNPLGEDDTL